ncbi:FMN-dependent dehydrogenase [Dactylonectria macrodidyma]|uniref:FMN-dependent dehydrogenase n=1 Tax=Dactylonectria macrodidyma TaxID=307937 RepID=A0A9P9JHU9_9HYPO|nr:FMN-dependent dehydrogenase [Dactylonectria macrodidyma]
MRSFLISVFLATGALAARPFLNEPDTGLEEVLGDTAEGTLPELTDMVGLPDFDWAARNYLPLQNYTYYRNGAAGEWSYRNNLEVFNRYTFNPSVMNDVTNIEDSLPTTILGHNFSAPFYISPCASGIYGHPNAELNFVKGAAAGNILYIPSGYATLSIEEIHAAKAEGQVVFQQLYLTKNDTATQELFDRSKEAGADALVFTVDAPIFGTRQRAARLDVSLASASSYRYITWDYYKKLQTMTDLPIIVKGIMSAKDAKLAVKNKVPAIVLSNHGGRQLDGAPSALEVALDIYKNAPEVFKKTEVYADGGVRYGTDALKLLALGVKAVGLGRPFMYSNVFGQEGVERAIELMKKELAVDGANLGLGDLKKIDASYVHWTPNNWSG